MTLQTLDELLNVDSLKSVVHKSQVKESLPNKPQTDEFVYPAIRSKKYATVRKFGKSKSFIHDQQKLPQVLSSDAHQKVHTTTEANDLSKASRRRSEEFKVASMELPSTAK